VPKPRPEIRVTFSPQDGELHVEGDLEAVKRFIEWYLDMAKKLQQAQAQEQKPQPEQRQAQTVEEKQEKPKPRQETRSHSQHRSTPLVCPALHRTTPG